MPRTFKDHFSSLSKSYRAHRPTYPAALYEHLASIAPSTGMAWDCATGNGQAATGLAGYFERVVATDASAAQIEQAEPAPNIEYRVAPAEQTPLDDASVDLVTVAQALHWFDTDAFFREADRVLKKDGILAVWTYGGARIEPAIEDVVLRFARDTVGPYWPPERALVINRYRDIAFPFRPVETPAFEMEAVWDLDDLLAYVGTWSAVKHYRLQTNVDPIEEVAASLGAVWGHGARPFRWPMVLHVRRK